MSRAVAPCSLAGAIAALAADPGLVPAAGCTDLMVAVTAGGPAGRDAIPGLLDLLGIPELAAIEDADGGLALGATVTFSRLQASPAVRARYPALAAAAATVGGWQIQNRATLGGNAANASPAGDALPVLLALDAVAVAAGPDGERHIPYREFHIGYRRTALRRGELLARLRLPAPPPGQRQFFRKVGTREAQAISKVVVAVAGRMEEGRLVGVRVAAGSVAATPVRLGGVEAALEGRPPRASLAGEAGELAAAAVAPIDDVRSTADYRRYVLGRVVRRLVLDLLTDSPARPGRFGP